MELNFKEIISSFDKLSKKQKEKMDNDLYRYWEKSVFKYQKIRKKNHVYPEHPTLEILHSLDLIDWRDFKNISDVLNGDFEKNGYLSNGKFSEELYESYKKNLIVSYIHVCSLVDRGLM